MIKVDCVSRVASGILKSKPSATSNLELPAKVALGALTALATDTFVMKCSSYNYNENGDIDNCASDYYCAFPY